MMSAEFEIEPGRWVAVFSGHLLSSGYSTARRSMKKDASWLSEYPCIRGTMKEVSVFVTMKQRI